MGAKNKLVVNSKSYKFKDKDKKNRPQTGTAFKHT